MSSIGLFGELLLLLELMQFFGEKLWSYAVLVHDHGLIEW